MIDDRIYFIEQGGFFYKEKEKKEGKYIYSNDPEQLNNLGLDENFRKQFDIKLSDKIKNCNILNLYAAKNVKAYNFVGLASYKGKVIEILPKIMKQFNNPEGIKKDDFDETIKNMSKKLMFMLSYIKSTDIYSNGMANQKLLTSPFLEVFILLYAKKLYALLLAHFKNSYRIIEDNLPVLKGKILWNKQIRYNYVNRHKFYQEYEEFDENHLMYIIFKTVSFYLINKTTLSENKVLLSQIISILENVDTYDLEESDFKKIHFDRQNIIYEEVFNLGHALYFEKIPSITKAENDFFAIFFDMNKVFEEFIFRFASAKFPQFNLHWGGRENIFKNDNNKNDNNRQFIEFDITKKDEHNEKYLKIYDAKNRLSNADNKIDSNYIYQMIAYMTISKAKSSCLIYQGIDNENDIAPLNVDCKNGTKMTIEKKHINIFSNGKDKGKGKDKDKDKGKDKDKDKGKIKGKVNDNFDKTKFAQNLTKQLKDIFKTDSQKNKL